MALNHRLDQELIGPEKLFEIEELLSDLHQNPLVAEEELEEEEPDEEEVPWRPPLDVRDCQPQEGLLSIHSYETLGFRGDQSPTAKVK